LTPIIRKTGADGLAPQQFASLLGFDLNIKNLIFIKGMRGLIFKIPKLAVKSFGPDEKNSKRA
jgi:hypothetical protein